MKRLITIMITMLAVSANAQDYSKMSRFIRQLCKEHETNILAAGAKGVSPTLSTTETNCVLAFVKAPEEAVSQYCIAHQGDIHIAEIPVYELATLSEDSRVVRIEASENKCVANLDSVATCENIRPVWSGSEPLPQAYDGTGTLIGVVDIGIDINHPAFRSKTNDRLRVVRLWDMLDFTDHKTYSERRRFPIGKLFTEESDILQKGYTADSKTECHGTHTTAIAAGSGYDTPYSGMAPEADIYSVGCIIGSNSSYVPSTVTSYNTTTLSSLAFQRIFEYADSIGKPCVISYSISGTQDMTDDDKLLDEYISEMTEKPGHILVASAGNSGNKHCYISKTEEQNTVGGILSSNENTLVTNISTQGELKLRITDYSRSADVDRTKEYTLDFLPGNKHKTSNSGLKWNDYYYVENIPELDSLTIYIYSGADGFDETRVGYDIFLYQKTKINSYKYGLEIIGEQTPAEIFFQNGELVSGTSYSSTLTGATAAGNCGSPGALPSVICAGYTAYWERGGKISYDSSRGPSLHGFIKPDITASGYKVTSAYNSVYQENNPNNFSLIKRSTYNGKEYGWVRMSGTSMSTPAVAGIIALWLEADPTLTRDRIKEVFEATSKHPEEALTYPNNTYGYGEIDAYKGLLYILGIDGIEGLDAEPLTQGTVLPANGGIKVSVNGQNTTALPCRVYDITGKLVSTAAITDGNITIPLPKGVYAVQVGKLGSTLVRVE